MNVRFNKPPPKINDLLLQSFLGQMFDFVSSGTSVQLHLKVCCAGQRYSDWGRLCTVAFVVSEAIPALVVLHCMSSLYSPPCLSVRECQQL